MKQDRREFLERLAVGTAVLGGFPDHFQRLGKAASVVSPSGSGWDLSWVDRITGKYRGVFDSPEINDGGAVFRANVWRAQYKEVLGVRPSEMSSVIVLRAKGIFLAMQQSFWDKYGIGKAKNVKNPMTDKPTTKSPVLMSSSRKEVPAIFDEYALDKQIASGVIVLACNLAFDEVIEVVKRKNPKLSDEAARAEAVAALIPGVILQPSGVFAVMRAQDAGCKYLRAS